MIKLYIGPMFSGKSNSLIYDYNKIWNKDNVICFKPKIDDRDFGLIKSRNSKGIKAICINKVSEIKNYLKNSTRTIFIDEVQFLKGDPQLLFKLSIEQDIDFYIAGLALSAEQKPFGIMPKLMALADEINYFEAICFDCNKPARYTYYEKGKSDLIKVGNDGYVPLCAKCLKIKKEQKELIRN